MTETDSRMFQFTCRRPNGAQVMLTALGEDEDEAREEAKRWARMHNVELMPAKAQECVLQ